MVNLKTVKDMVKELILLQMETNMWGNSKTRMMDKELTFKSGAKDVGEFKILSKYFALL